MMPNRLQAPLTPDEAFGEQYSDRPGPLREIAMETGNRSLAGIARATRTEQPHKAKEDRQRQAAQAGKR